MKKFKTRHKKKQKIGGDMIEVGSDRKKGRRTEIPWQIIGIEIFAQPGQILSQLQYKTMYFTPLKKTIRPFYMIISSSKQVFYTLWTRLLQIQKSKKIFYFDQVIVKNQSWTICSSELAEQKNQKETCCHVFFWKLP